MRKSIRDGHEWSQGLHYSEEVLVYNSSVTLWSGGFAIPGCSHLKQKQVYLYFPQLLFAKFCPTRRSLTKSFGK